MSHFSPSSDVPLDQLIDIDGVGIALRELVGWDEDDINHWIKENESMLRDPWTPHEGTAWIVGYALMPVTAARKFLTTNEQRVLAESIQSVFPFPMYSARGASSIPWSGIRDKLDSTLKQFGLNRADIRPTVVGGPG